jgi:hypothetical protein
MQQSSVTRPIEANSPTPNTAHTLTRRQAPVKPDRSSAPLNVGPTTVRPDRRLEPCSVITSGVGAGI